MDYYTKWPFFADHAALTDTYAEILCHSGDTFAGDIQDLMMTVNDGKLGIAILLSPRTNDPLYGIGSFVIPMSFVKAVKRKGDDVQICL